jgi:hypothetical protein
LATPNYGYEKRQKELAKKRKKEDKLKSKAERKSDGPDDLNLGEADAPDQLSSATDAPPSNV